MKMYQKWIKKEKPSLRWMLLMFMLLCWVVPVIVCFLFATMSYQEGIIKKTEDLIEGQLEGTASFISMRLDDAISVCQSPSYERSWEKAWKNYRNGNTDRMYYLSNISSSLKGKFYLNNRISTYAYYEAGEEEPACYSSKTRVTIQNYMETVNDQVKVWMKSGSDYPHVEVIDNRVFVIRNLYTTREYKYFGTLVVELNKKKLLKDIPLKEQDAVTICINDTEECLNYDAVLENTGQDRLLDRILNQYNDGSRKAVKQEKNSIYNAYLYEKKSDNYRLGIIYMAERREIYSSLYEMYDMLLIVAIVFMPLICYVAYFLRKQIQEPIGRLTVAAGKMEEGNIGIKVGGEMPNVEFNYLMESFDSMSAQVKELFDYIYDEKLARKDAQILALQAQINPHFLNNTLEMMNWQARINGDLEVSKMIESLGTVLDYRMNRANVKEIYLADELRCIDAYFYIMSMRFGQRLQVEREIDEELLYVKVPPLILQPLAENAIVHGVESAKNGNIRLHVYHDDAYTYLKVINTGKELSEEELERIQSLLSGDAEKIPAGKGRHTSIGIRNVNKRIKLMYGEEYGLTIRQEEKGVTVSTIQIPYEEGQDDELEELKKEEWQNKERQKVEDELKNIHKNYKKI